LIIFTAIGEIDFGGNKYLFKEEKSLREIASIEFKNYQYVDNK
jgi:hypothetical protein